VPEADIIFGFNSLLSPFHEIDFKPEYLFEPITWRSSGAWACPYIFLVTWGTAGAGSVPDFGVQFSSVPFSWIWFQTRIFVWTCNMTLLRSLTLSFYFSINMRHRWCRKRTSFLGFNCPISLEISCNPYSVNGLCQRRLVTWRSSGAWACHAIFLVT